jgi:uncharacterized protein YkwD
MTAGLALAIALLETSHISIPTLEHKIHTLINSERQTAKIMPLVLDEELSKIARGHSQDMAKRGFFDHVNPDGKSPRDRVRMAGYNCPKTVGENIFQNNLYSRVQIRGTVKTYYWNSLDEIATSTVQGWMSSPGHRQNILQREYGKTGIGVAIADDEVFCG